MLTTIDNPYNPYKDYDKWSMWDHAHHYNTAEYMARMIPSTISVEEAWDNEALIDSIIEDIITNDSLGLYCLINETDETPISIEAYEDSIKKF